MRKKWTLSEDALQSLKAAMAGARSKEEYQRALCVWLPVALGLTAPQAASALGCTLSIVEGVWKRYRRRGESALGDGRLRPLPADAAETLRAALKRARTADERRRVECVWLRLVLGLEQQQVAAALNCSIGLVSKVQADYLKSGIAGLRLAPEVAGPAEPGAAELRAALKGACSVQHFRRLQCIWMLELGLSRQLVAKILGWNPGAVTVVDRKYRRYGPRALGSLGRGGARARLLTIKQEADLLRGLRAQPWPYGILRFSQVQTAMETMLGHPVKPSSVHSMLDRHGWWSRAAWVINPMQAPAIPGPPGSLTPTVSAGTSSPLSATSAAKPPSG